MALQREYGSAVTLIAVPHPPLITKQCRNPANFVREMPALTEHHLIPRQKTKRKGLGPSPTIQICSACHRQIHRLYNNSHLALHLNTLEKLRQDPQLQKFLSWVHKQDPNRRVKIDRKR